MTDASEIKKKGAVCHPPSAVRLDNLLRVRQAQPDAARDGRDAGRGEQLDMII